MKGMWADLRVRRGLEVVERHEEGDAQAVLTDDVVEKEEIDAAAEVDEQVEVILDSERTSRIDF